MTGGYTVKITQLIKALSSARAEMGDIEVLIGMNKTPIAGMAAGQLLPRGHLAAAPIFPDEATPVIVLLSPSEVPNARANLTPEREARRVPLKRQL
jgi:hypothetical protein